MWLLVFVEGGHQCFLQPCFSKVKSLGGTPLPKVWICDLWAGPSLFLLPLSCAVVDCRKGACSCVKALLLLAAIQNEGGGQEREGGEGRCQARLPEDCDHSSRLGRH